MTVRLDESCRQLHELMLLAWHELKTPLTVMRAQLETELRDDATLSGAEREWICSLLDEVQRLAKIVDSLSLLTKADAGLVALQCEPVPLSDLVREAAEDAVYLAQAQGIHVALTTCEDTAVTGDRHRLRQLLLILTDNAVKDNRPGEVSASRCAHERALRRSRSSIFASEPRSDPETEHGERGRLARRKQDEGRRAHVCKTPAGVKRSGASSPLRPSARQPGPRQRRLRDP